MNAMLRSADVAAPLRCAAIRKRYKDQVVLDDVSLTIPQGSVLGLIGRNGAGKTTLIRILLGLQLADAGTVALFGQSPLSLDDGAKARLGYVPQHPDALAWMSVADMLAFIGACYPTWDRDYVSQALRRWDIPADKTLAKLSPGERQRVALIRALAPRPALLVLDEPAAALDPAARRDLLVEIATRASDAGTTVLFSTHIISDLERVASQVVFLHQGRVLLDAAMDDLRDTHARLRVPRAAAPSSSVHGELARRTHADGSVSLILQRPVGAAWPAIAEVAGARLDVIGLEDLFVEVTT